MFCSISASVENLGMRVVGTTGICFCSRSIRYLDVGIRELYGLLFVRIPYDRFRVVQ